MNFEIIDPIDYPSWDELLLKHGDHSFFHTSAWAKVLAESYRYKPTFFVSFEDSRLSFLMPFMEVASPITGKRGVSLPFTDLCNTFSLAGNDKSEAIPAVIEFGKRSKWKYIEWRSSEDFLNGIIPNEMYFTHDISLGKSEQELFSSFKESNRRNINKALKTDVRIKIDQSSESLCEFFWLNCLTRKRHGLPPQPRHFFNSVFNHVLKKESGIIVSALFSQRVIASSVFFHFGEKAIYKYGASLTEYQHLRPNNMVMWEALRWYQNRGLQTMNLGRTELENQGLLQYKRTWGGEESLLRYFRYEMNKKTFVYKNLGSVKYYSNIFARTPIPILRLIGRLLYKHAG